MVWNNSEVNMELKEIGVAIPKCPYCNIELANFPLRKTKCINCGNDIYVKKRPLDGKKVLIKEDELQLIKEEWNKSFAIKEVEARKNLPQKIIYSTQKPKCLDFVSDKDFIFLLDLYLNNKYGIKNLDSLYPVCPYEKYNWFILLKAVWVNQNYYKTIKEFKEAGIKKIKFDCISDCQECKNIKNKIISIDNAIELPLKSCLLNHYSCYYQAVIDYND